MKAFKAISALLVLAVFYAGCASDTKNKSLAGVNEKNNTVKVVSGDFNGDGKADTVQLIKPKLNTAGTACLDSSCTAYIRFSDTSIHPIAIKNCIGGTPDNLGDLNGDGRDEIGLLPDWFTSCWREYRVLTYKNNEWVNAVPPIPTHCNQWEAHVKPIEKDSLNKGYVVIHYSEMVDKDIVTKSKIIAIK
jgi:hypothetical protein